MGLLDVAGLCGEAREGEVDKPFREIYYEGLESRTLVFKAHQRAFIGMPTTRARARLIKRLHKQEKWY